jgi:mannosyltransferase OCH1-like enzyme
MKSIPKIIHYCWFGKNDMNNQIKLCIDSWESYFKDYNFIKWDEYNSPMNHPYVIDAYKNKKYAFVSDYVRLYALYNFGGIYLDTDMIFVNTFTFSNHQTCILAYENDEQDRIGCGFIASIKGHKFIHQILMNYNYLTFHNDNISKLVISKIVKENYLNYLSKDVTILNYDVFYPFPYEKRKEINFYKYQTKNTIAIHLWSKSWDKHFYFFSIIYLIKRKFFNFVNFK